MIPIQVSFWHGKSNKWIIYDDLMATAIQCCEESSKRIEKRIAESFFAHIIIKSHLSNSTFSRPTKL